MAILSELLIIAEVVLSCAATFTTLVINTKNVYMSTSATQYSNVATECHSAGLEEYFVGDNGEFGMLQSSLSGSQYVNTIFWVKVRQEPAPGEPTGLKYYWENEEIVRSAWFFGPSGYREPNNFGDGCQNDPFCCVRLSTKWGIGFSNEQSSVSGLHELTDISCEITAIFFCVDPVVTTEATTMETTTEAPTTEAATTQPPPTTESPTTQPPTTTEAPTTQPPPPPPPTTEAATTQPPPPPPPPTTEAATTQPPPPPQTTEPATTSQPSPGGPEEPTTSQPEESTSAATAMQPTRSCPNATGSDLGAYSSVRGLWACQCSSLVPNASLEAIQPVIRATRRYLYVHVPSLSSTRRKLTSAEDSRPSSIALGTVAVTFMAFAYGTVVLLDLVSVVCSRRSFWHRTS